MPSFGTATKVIILLYSFCLYLLFWFVLRLFFQSLTSQLEGFFCLCKAVNLLVESKMHWLKFDRKRWKFQFAFLYFFLLTFIADDNADFNQNVAILHSHKKRLECFMSDPVLMINVERICSIITALRMEMLGNWKLNLMHYLINLKKVKSFFSINFCNKKSCD